MNDVALAEMENEKLAKGLVFLRSEGSVQR